MSVFCQAKTEGDADKFLPWAIPNRERSVDSHERVRLALTLALVSETTQEEDDVDQDDDDDDEEEEHRQRNSLRRQSTSDSETSSRDHSGSSQSSHKRRKTNRAVTQLKILKARQLQPQIVPTRGKQPDDDRPHQRPPSMVSNNTRARCDDDDDRASDEHGPRVYHRCWSNNTDKRRRWAPNHPTVHRRLYIRVEPEVCLVCSLWFFLSSLLLLLLLLVLPKPMARPTRSPQKPSAPLCSSRLYFPIL